LVVKDNQPQLRAEWRQHWRLENQLHYIREMTSDEDRATVHTAHAPKRWPPVALRSWGAAAPRGDDPCRLPPLCGSVGVRLAFA